MSLFWNGHVLWVLSPLIGRAARGIALFLIRDGSNGGALVMIAGGLPRSRAKAARTALSHLRYDACSPLEIKRELP